MFDAPEWYSRARCKPGADVDAEIFFPATPGRRAGMPAKRFCSGCDVRTHCLQFSLDNNEQGVWGGLNDTERRELRRRISRPA